MYKITKHLFINLLIFTIFGAIFTVGASAATKYVSTTGSNSNAGTSAAPWLTVQYGVDNIAGGDTLKIAAGTYNETVRVKPAVNGTSGARTIIEPWNINDVVTITYNTETQYVMRVESDYTTVRNIRFDGLASETAAATNSSSCLVAKPNSVSGTDLIDVLFENITSKHCSGHGIEVGGGVVGGTQYYTSGTVRNSLIEYSAMTNYNGAAGSSGWGSGLKIYRGGRNITLRNNEIRNNWGEGVAITRGENVIFEDNLVHNNYSVNIYIDNSKNTTVRRNYSYCINSAGAILRSGSKASGISVGEEYYDDTPLWGNQLSGLTLVNNLVYNCSRGFTWYGTDNNPASGGLDNTVIAFNTFYLTDNSSSAIYLDGEIGDNIQFKNNIIKSAAGAAWLDNGIGTYDFNYNYWVNSNDPSQEELQGANDVLNTEANLDFDGIPGFTTIAFKIGVLSAAKNVGVTISGVSTDYFTNNRDSSRDIGFSEYVAIKSIYVDKDSIGGACNDSNAGTISSPVCTVAQAITMANPGDTIYLRTGTYPLINVNKSGTSGNVITIRNNGSEVVTVSAGAATGDSIRLSDVYYIKIQGLRVTGANGSYNSGIHVYKGGNNTIESNIVYNNTNANGQGIFIDSSSNNSITGNTTYGNYENGIVVSSALSPSAYNSIVNNTSYSNTLGGGNSDGIKLQDQNTQFNTVSGNTVYSNADDGIDTWTSSYNTISSNIVYNQTGPGDGNGFKLGGNSLTSGKNTVKFNIAYGNLKNGFDVNGGAGNTYYHNIAYNNGHYGFEDGYRNASCTIALCPSTFIGNIGMNNTTGNFSANTYTTVSHNNLWFDATTSQPKVRYNYVTYNTLAAFYTASTNTLDNPSNGTLSSKSANPLFSNAGAANFNLTALSPAIDAGDPANPAGVTVSGTYPDIGVYEYTPSSNTYYIDEVGGSDANSGLSQANAWQTINNVNNTTFQPGDSIMFKKGQTFDFPYAVQFNGNGTSGSRITIGSYGTGADPIFSNTNTTGEFQHFDPTMIIWGQYYTVQDIKIDNTVGGNINEDGISIRTGNVIVDGVEVTGVGAGIKVRESSNVEIRNSYFHDLIMIVNDASADNDFGAIAVSCVDCSNVTVENNTFQDIDEPSTDYGSDGAVFEVFRNASNIVVRNNFIKNVEALTEYGSDDSSDSASNVVYHHNLVINADSLGVFHNNAGNFGMNIEQIYFDNNTFIKKDADTSGFTFAYDIAPSAGDFFVRNNIFKYSNSNLWAINFGSTNHTNNIYNLTGITTGFGGNTTNPSYALDPSENKNTVIFTNEASDDYTLQSGSAGINTGANLGYTSDLDGNAVPTGVGYEVGAFEYQGGVAMNYITNINVALDLVDKDTDESLESGGTGSGSAAQNVRIKDNTSGRVIADIVVDMSSNKDWSSVTGGFDSGSKESFIHNLTSAPGAASSYSLYVPKDVSDNTVIICPGASSLAQVDAGCAGEQILDSGSENVSVVNIEGNTYWKVDDLTGTGGKSAATSTGSNLTLTPSNWTGVSAQTVCMTYITQNGEFVNGETINFAFSPSLSSPVSNATPTADTDADNDSTSDGSFTTLTNSSAIYTFTGNTTQATTNGVNLCLNFPAGTTAASYSVSYVDAGGTFGAALLYVGGDNQVNVIVEVQGTFSFNIRTLDDTADTNVCDLGTVSTSTLPDIDITDDGAGECGYAIAIGANATNGFTVQIDADGPLNNSGANIANAAEDQAITAGVEAYGLVHISASQTGRNNLSGLYDQTITKDGNFNDDAQFTPIPTSATNFVSYTDGIAYVAGTDAIDTTRVIHGLTIGAGTPAGMYDQLITYTLTLNF